MKVLISAIVLLFASLVSASYGPETKNVGYPQTAPQQQSGGYAQKGGQVMGRQQSGQMKDGEEQQPSAQIMNLKCPKLPQKDCPELKNVSKLTFSLIGNSFQAICIYGTSGSCNLSPLTGSFCVLNNVYFGPDLVRQGNNMRSRFMQCRLKPTRKGRPPSLARPRNTSRNGFEINDSFRKSHYYYNID